MPTARLEDIQDAPASPEQEVIPETTSSEKPDEAGATYDWSSTQFNIPEPISTSILKWADDSLPKESLVGEEGEGEDEPHVTILYGIDASDSSQVADALKDQQPVIIKIGKLSLFENSDSDVLKLGVESPDMEALNKLLRGKIPHIETHFEYEPHITVGYLKIGEGGEFDGKPIAGVTGKRVKLSTVTFSSKDGSKVDIQLGSPEESTSKPAAQGEAEQPAVDQSQDPTT